MINYDVSFLNLKKKKKKKVTYSIDNSLDYFTKFAISSLEISIPYFKTWLLLINVSFF